MGVMDKQIGTMESIFITYGSGGLLVGLAMLWYRGGNLSAWQDVPWYTLTAGVLGLIIVGTIGFSTPRLGLVTAMTIIITTQFITGALVDHFGVLGAELRPLTLVRMAGIGLVLAGTWLVVRG